MSNAQIEIHERRKKFQPSEVRLHHVPNWMRLMLLRKCGTRTPGWTKGSDLIWHLDHLCGGDHRRILDHWGSTITSCGRRDFVTEPYMDAELACLVARRVARAIHCEFYVSDNSWWFPGRTIRIGFIEPLVDAVWSDHERRSLIRSYAEGMTGGLGIMEPVSSTADIGRQTRSSCVSRSVEQTSSATRVVEVGDDGF
jgi:hypothetical protein